MGNNLGYIARAYGFQLMLQREFSVPSTIVLRHQEHPKHRRAQNDVQKCFPVTRPMQFSGGNFVGFEDVLKRNNEEFRGTFPDGNITQIRLSLQLLKEMVKNNANQTDNQKMQQQIVPESNASLFMSNWSVPFLHTREMTMGGFFMDKYYDDFRSYFFFDEASCCKIKPNADESVFVSNCLLPFFD